MKPTIPSKSMETRPHKTNSHRKNLNSIKKPEEIYFTTKYTGWCLRSRRGIQQLKGEDTIPEQKNIFHLPRSFVEKYWEPSYSLDISKKHFREKPPGTGHAICDPKDNICEVHYDKVNPHEDLLGHFIEDAIDDIQKFGPAAIKGLKTYNKTKSCRKALMSSLKTGVSFLSCIYKSYKWLFSMSLRKIIKT